MAHSRIENSVPRHKKFLQAGPAASWLWLAGVCYANEGLTDGHIPAAALSTLGVPGASRLVTRLLSAGLWDVDPDGDGWRIHDFLQQNRTAEEVRIIRDKRRNAGAAGGVVSGLKRKQSASSEGSKVLNPITVTVTTPTTVTPTGVVAAPEPPLAVNPPDYPFTDWLRELHARYPEHRRMPVRNVERLFWEAFSRHDDVTPPDLWTLMQAGLALQVVSPEWTGDGGRFIPKLDRWLLEDGWTRTPQPIKADQGAALSGRTQRLLAGRAAIAGGMVS